jgi:hypothetical protein
MIEKEGNHDGYTNTTESGGEGQSDRGSDGAFISERQEQRRIAEDYLDNLPLHHRDEIICQLVRDCLGWTSRSLRSSFLLSR